MEPTKEQCRIVGSAVLADITDRRGLRQEWDQIDRDIQNEIRETIGRLAIQVWERIRHD